MAQECEKGRVSRRREKWQAGKQEINGSHKRISEYKNDKTREEWIITDNRRRLINWACRPTFRKRLITSVKVYKRLTHW